MKSTVLITILALAVPALRAAGPAAPRRVPTIGKLFPGEVEVSAPHDRWVRGRFLVSGVIHRKAGRSTRPLQIHLDFIVLDSGQRTLSFFQVNHLPRAIPVVYRGILS